MNSDLVPGKGGPVAMLSYVIYYVFVFFIREVSSFSLLPQVDSWVAALQRDCNLGSAGSKDPDEQEKLDSIPKLDNNL